MGRTTPLLLDSLVIAICAVLGTWDDGPDLVVFAQKRQAWFQRLVRLPGGIPPQDTFERVFAALDPRACERCGLAWLHEGAGLVAVGHSGSDGKALCGSAGARLGPLPLVSAWATQANLTLAQVAGDGKSNESPAIPQLLGLSDLHGALVTLDAIGGPKAIAKEVVAGGGDYVRVVKGDQGQLGADIQEAVARALAGGLPQGVVRTPTTREQGPGRTEGRSGVAVGHVAGSRDRQAWPQRTTVGRCRRARAVAGQTSEGV